MSLNLSLPCFVTERDVVLRIEPKMSTSKNAINHLILGDYAKFLGEEQNEWVKVRSRNDNGWLKKNWLSNERILEVNFVDIGQGDGCHIVTPDDEVILIDAGVGTDFDGKGADNMARFINWRYNLRNRKSPNPFEIDYAVISHPDLDHYYGFHNIFSNEKLKIKKICHNGIVERPLNGADSKTWFKDLGRQVSSNDKKISHLWDIILTNEEMHNLLEENPTTTKFFIKTLRAAKTNNPKVIYKFLDISQKYLDHFKPQKDLSLEILAPITEKVNLGDETRDCLIKLGSEGETKNGHSVVFMLRYKNLKMLLGGDLNTKSQDYIAQYYSQNKTTISSLERKIRETKIKLGGELSSQKRKDLQQEYEEAIKLLDLIVSKTKNKFQADIAKACHHGASDVLDSFLKAINPIATIISSGDNESHSHPRPDALGAYGKSGRGNRPLIFSTELARSTYEFSYPIKFYNKLKAMEEQIETLTDKKKIKNIIKEMENLKDSNVAKYGMITVRTNGERVIIAQKLEEERSPGQKWDIYDLIWNEKLNEFEYIH